jgi:hypothetical protein
MLDKRKTGFVVALGFGICTAVCATSVAQGQKEVSAVDENRETTYYPQPTYRPEPRFIIHEKAQARAYQRQARLASMSWYGISSSRPTTATTPFMSRYGSVWEMPGGRPYSWYPTYGWPAYSYYVR